MRRPWFTTGFLITTCMFGVLSMKKAQAANLKIAVGQPFPTIALPSMEDGRPSSLAEFRGKRVLLHIWASW